VATTFINKEVEESALLDLKHLLIEAKQRVPPVRILYCCVVDTCSIVMLYCCVCWSVRSDNCDTEYKGTLFAVRRSV
jgi:exosome complex RNA-binding protein Rrp42 (RNase PH superfamily)